MARPRIDHIESVDIKELVPATRACILAIGRGQPGRDTPRSHDMATRKTDCSLGDFFGGLYCSVFAEADHATVAG